MHCLCTYLLVILSPLVNDDSVDPEARREVLHAAVTGDQQINLVVPPGDAALPVDGAVP